MNLSYTPIGCKYSEKLGAFVQTKNEKKISVEMGSYGIGISRLVGALIEAFHDEKGIIWPIQVAPFKVAILNLNIKDKKCNEFSQNIYSELKNITEVLYDDRDVAPGVKFSDIDLIGIPYKIIIGPRDLKNNQVEIEERKTGKKIKFSKNEAINYIQKNTNI